jgi:hypothetical protein
MGKNLQKDQLARYGDPAPVRPSGAVHEKLEGEESSGTRACSLKGYAEPVTAYLM